LLAIGGLRAWSCEPLLQFDLLQHRALADFRAALHCCLVVVLNRPLRLRRLSALLREVFLRFLYKFFRNATILLQLRQQRLCAIFRQPFHHLKKLRCRVFTLQKTR
jgi:hypothetical protein